jgi:MFS family permease
MPLESFTRLAVSTTSLQRTGDESCDESTCSYVCLCVSHTLSSRHVISFPLKYGTSKLTNQLDKSSVSYAAVFDLREATHLVGTQYSWLTSVVYVAQLCFQPLSSYALIVLPVKYWVMFNFISWSIITIATAAAHNFTGLVICRLLLGAFEATILPSFVFITQMWYSRRYVIPSQMGNLG